MTDDLPPRRRPEGWASVSNYLLAIAVVGGTLGAFVFTFDLHSPEARDATLPATDTTTPPAPPATPGPVKVRESAKAPEPTAASEPAQEQEPGGNPEPAGTPETIESEPYDLDALRSACAADMRAHRNDSENCARYEALTHRKAD